MSLPAPAPDPDALASALGEPLAGIEPLAKGATCQVWKLTTRRRAYVLRLFSGRPSRTDLPAEIRIRGRMADAGAAVAEPILSSLDRPDLHPGTPWVLDAFVAGSHYARGALASRAAADLGRTLALLHGLPAQAFGVPAPGPAGGFRGSAATAIAGLHTRFEDPLPAEPQALAAHPAVQAAPDLAGRLQPLLQRVRDEVSQRKGVLCHADLHERQFICRDGRLAALIDFGDATIADPRWDFASLLYFHGPEILAAVLTGYTEDPARRRQLGADAVLFSLGIALHHAARSRHPGRGHRLAVATAYLRRALRHTVLAD